MDNWLRSVVCCPEIFVHRGGLGLLIMVILVAMVIIGVSNPYFFQVLLPTSIFLLGDFVEAVEIPVLCARTWLDILAGKGPRTWKPGKGIAPSIKWNLETDLGISFGRPLWGIFDMRMLDEHVANGGQ